MKKVIAVEFLLVLLLVGVMTLLLYKKEPRSNVTEAEVHTMFASVVGDAPVTEAGSLRIRRVFDLNAADYDMIVYYTPVETMDVCEFILIRTNEANASAAKTALEQGREMAEAAFLADAVGYNDPEVARAIRCEILNIPNSIIP